MRIVDQSRLWFQEGKSDKVYEVDLVEVASDQYVVNFRYGRRGTALRDGTKTPVPVSLDRARTIFAALVAEKVKGGYRSFGEAQAAQGGASASQPSKGDGASLSREQRTRQALLHALAQGNRGDVPLYLTIRKVGERGIREAEPLLLELLAHGKPPSGMKPAAFRHFVVAALARCGSSSSFAPLWAVADDAKAPQHLRDVSRVALLMLGAPGLRERTLEQLPAALRPRPDSDVQALVSTLEQQLATRRNDARAHLFALYLLSPSQRDDPQADEASRNAWRVVLGVVRVARLHEDRGLLRTLQWAAELRRDGPLFALLTRRFESKRERMDRDTQGYFRRRSARVLRRLGAIGSPDYVKLASELCLLYRDAHAEPVREGYPPWDAFGYYHALNFVLYGESPRYQKGGHRRATWRCADGYRPGQPAPLRREESYPALWDQAPEALWALGVSPAATIVIHFATRALREQASFWPRVSDESLADAMSTAHALMRALAFEQARARTPNAVLAHGALRSDREDAERWVLAWLARDSTQLLAHPALLGAMLVARTAEVREEAQRLGMALTFDGEQKSRVVMQAIAALMALRDEPGQAERALVARSYLLQACSEVLLALGPEVVRDLLTHSLGTVAELGAEIVFLAARSGPLAGTLLDALLGSPHAGVRSVGARILADTPPEIVKDAPELLVQFALSDNAELREGTRGLLGEVARRYPEVGTAIASELIEALLHAQPDGAPRHVVSLLRAELHACLPRRDAQSVLALLGALSPHAREAGGLLLPTLSPDDLGLDTIVRLASHEILLVRQGAWALASAAKDRFMLTPVALARLCDARWHDSRAFAFAFVRTFPESALVPDGVIAICDSVNPEVQRFGQDLLLEHWGDEHAGRYIVRLAEHPSTNIQLLVSGLLERHARNNLTMLRELVPYLATVLSQVNRGGVAKQRVLEFLQHEAVASREAAELLAPLLDRQSLTRAVSHRAPLIATMVGVHALHPQVALPIVVATPPVHARGTRGV